MRGKRFSDGLITPSFGFGLRDDRWSAVAVGSREFVENVKGELGVKAVHRDVIAANGSYALRESTEAYGLTFAAENEALRSQNTFLWDEKIQDATT